MKSSIWIAGASGRIGKELMKRLKKNPDYKIVGTDLDVDVTNVESVEQAADIYRPTVIINCASISNEKYCEDHMVEAFKINALGARNLAQAARKHNAKIIQLSSDDVFSGKNFTRLTEFDTPLPQTVYGKSKLAGENYVRELNPKHLIIRSSWVYGACDHDFYACVMEKGKNNESFEVPTDRFSTPTSAYTLADFICSLVEKTEYGIFHASCEGKCSRYEFASEILRLHGYEPALAIPVQSKTGETSTLLENLMMKMTDLYEMPEWKLDLKNHVDHEEVSE